MQRPLPLLGVLFLGWAVATHAEGLVDVYRLAEQNDANLRAAAQTRLATRETYPQVQAQLLPNVTLNAGLTRDWLEYPNVPTRDGSFTGKNYSVSLQQPLFDRARLTALDQAELIVRQADLDYANSQQELLLRASEAYFAVLRAQAELSLAEAELAANESRLAQTEKRFEVGLIAITDLADARAARDQSLARRIGAEANLANAREALRVLTVQEVASLDDVRPELATALPDPADPAAWVKLAEERNLALQSLRMGLDIARQEIEKQRSGHYPTLSLNASYGYQDTQLAGTPLENHDTRVGVQLNVPLYAGGGVSARVREATYKFQRAQDLYEAGLRDTTRVTRDAFRAVTSKISEIAAFEQSVKSAETQLAANEAGYEVGTRTIVDVITAQTLLTQARRNLFNARYDYLLATLRLKRAAGTLRLADLEALQQQALR
ncbi:MAG: TolC family outer membrane protein [Halothiobacillaceae bacterium]